MVGFAERQLAVHVDVGDDGRAGGRVHDRAEMASPAPCPALPAGLGEVQAGKGGRGGEGLGGGRRGFAPWAPLFNRLTGRGKIIKVVT